MPSPSMASFVRFLIFAIATSQLIVPLGMADDADSKPKEDEGKDKRILEQLLKDYEDSGHHFSAYYQGADLPPLEALAHLAFAHWANEVLKPNADGALIAKHLKALFEANPNLDQKGKRYLLDSLEKSLVPTLAKPGS